MNLSTAEEGTVQRHKVPDVLGHKCSIFVARPPQELIVREPSQDSRAANSDDIVAAVAESRGDGGREVLIEEQPHRASAVL